jgi:uncharacterized protein (DUF1499 family)
MAIVKWLLIVIVGLVVVVLAAGQLGLLRGTAPSDLGVTDGRMKPPSSTPNSVSSQTALHPGHPQHEYAEIAPLALHGDGGQTMAALQRVVAAMPGAEVIVSRPDYLHVQFTTTLMKFVDDAEFWLDPVNNVVQVRSASRIGQRDMGVNRARIEAVRAALATQPVSDGINAN